MQKLMILCVLFLVPLFYPCETLLCWDCAGKLTGSWSEISCDGNSYSGTWTGSITNDCSFVGIGEWESITGKINFSNKTLAAAGLIRDDCGPSTISGKFTNNFLSVSGNYAHRRGGGGSFTGRIQY